MTKAWVKARKGKQGQAKWRRERRRSGEEGRGRVECVRNVSLEPSRETANLLSRRR